MDDYLDVCSYLALKSSHAMGMYSELIHLPAKAKKYCTIKGVFVHAKSKQIFESRLHSRLIQVYDSHPDSIKEWIEFVNKSLPQSVSMTVSEYQWTDSLDFENNEEQPVDQAAIEYQNQVKKHYDEFMLQFNKQ